jgi:hypothetical protein
MIPEVKLVQSLIGSGNQFPFYLKCLKSLTDHCQEKISLLIHSDGSLSKNDAEIISAHFESQHIKISDPVTARETTLDKLEGRPNCQRTREESLWGIEFFDPLFSNPEDSVSHYIDADILFFRPFCRLFNDSVAQGGAVFLRDKQWDAYSLRPWHLVGRKKKPEIVRGITTALVCWDKQAIDWDYLEWFLGQVRYHAIPEWVLPTAQAGLANRCQAKTVLHQQVPNLYPNATISEETFGLHLLGSYRSDWESKIEHHVKGVQSGQSPTKARFELCKPRGALAYGCNQAKRWLNTRLNLW